MCHTIDQRAVSEHIEIDSLFNKLISQDCHHFPPNRITLDAPKDPGVYIIRDRIGRVAHVGETPRGRDGLWQRLTNHANGLSSFVIWHLNKDHQRLRANYTYQYLVVKSPRLRALLECYVAGKLCPLHIHESIEPDILVNPAL